MFYLESIRGEAFKRGKRNDKRFCKWFQAELEDAIAASRDYHDGILETLRQYEGQPEHPYRSTPFENSPNLEVPLIAIATDALVAQATTTIFSMKPILTVTPTNKTWTKHAPPLQAFVNWGVNNEFNLRSAADHTIMDVVQLGTGATHTPFIKLVRKTRVVRIVDFGPQIQAIPIEDLIVPGGSTQDVNRLPWIGIRCWMSRKEVRAHASLPEDRQDRWTIDKKTLEPFQVCGAISDVRQQRESLSRTSSNSRLRDLYEVILFYGMFDYDNDGEDEELFAIFDRTSAELGWIGYTPHDLRPIEKDVYQVRAHVWNGLGVGEMLRMFQRDLTDQWNERAINTKLANFRMWAAREGVLDEGILTAFENRVITMQNPKEDLVGVQLGEVYPSSGMFTQATLALAEKRVGLTNLTVPSASGAIGTRTPAFTTASLIQRENNRFAPAFDNIRRLLASSVRQCLWRYHEELRRERPGGMAHTNIEKVLGREDAQLVIELLKRDDFVQCVSVELTASTAAVNQDTERQNALLLANFLGTYGEKILQLVTIASTPQTPEPVKEAAKKLAEAASAIAERTIRTFDQIRDPYQYIVDVNDELDKAVDMQQNGMGMLTQLLGFLQSSAQQPPGAPPVA